MPKRQKATSESEDDYDLSDSFVVEDDYDEKPNKKKHVAKKAAAGKKKEADDGDDGDKKKKPKKEKAPPPPPNPTEPTTYADGFTVHPPSLIYKANPFAQGGTKIAAVDLDGTLITRKSGLAFAVDANDWQFFNTEVINKLKQAVNDGYQILIVSNQSGIGKALLGAASVKTRTIAKNVLDALEAEGIQAQVTMATYKDNFRKPETGMWDFFVANLNKGVVPNIEESFYVGDAAGRPGDISNNSDSDKAFAANVGLKFYVPEEYFGEGRKGPDVTVPSNAGLVDAFFELGTLLKEKGDNFKATAFLKVSTIIAGLDYAVTSGKQVKTVKGIGKSSQDKIDEFVRSGKIAAIADIKGESAQDAAVVNKQYEAAVAFL